MSTTAGDTEEQIRQTAVKTKPATQLGRSLNPTRVFVDKDRTAFLWFCVAVLAIAFAAAHII